jgi:hypothetical protein
MRTTNLVHDVTSTRGGAPPEKPLYKFTAEQVAALDATRAKLNFTPADRAAFKKRQRRTEALLQKMADSTPDECVQLDDEFWRDLRAENRIMSVRRGKTRPARLMAVVRPRSRGAGRPRAQATRSSAASGDSGDPEPPDVEPWRWASLDSWRAFVESVNSRDFEDQVARERWSR